MLEQGGFDKDYDINKRELLIKKALDTLTRNITYVDQEKSVSLKDRLLQSDQSQLRRRGEGVLFDFNSIFVEGLFGAASREGSIFIKPYLGFNDIQDGTTRMGVQPMGLDLESIETDKNRRHELAERVWSEVSKEQKMALLLNHIEVKKLSEERQIAQNPSLVEEGRISSGLAESWTQDSRRRIQTILNLQNAIAEDSFVIEVSDADASLIFSPVARHPKV